MYEQNKVRVKISIPNIINNYNMAKKACKSADVLAIVKADGYGHGALEIAKAVQQNCGCKSFAVANLDEAISLRNGGVEGMILVLGYTNSEQFNYLTQYNLSQTVTDMEYLCKISDYAKQNGKVNIHIKIDTGMNRIGFCYNDEKQLKEVALLLCSNENLVKQGIFTHFVCSEDTENTFTQTQIERFIKVKEVLAQNGVKFLISHACNSAGIYNYPEAHFDMVRLGIGLYGFGSGNGLLPAMEYSASIVSVHKVKKGETVSYNQTFTANRDMTVAVVCAGYADGVRRALSNKGRMYINGAMCPIVGRVCMDMTMVDVSEIQNKVKIGDRAEMFGSHISCEEVAALCDTVSYEIICGVSKRVPRIYE